MGAASRGGWAGPKGWTQQTCSYGEYRGAEKRWGEQEDMGGVAGAQARLQWYQLVGGPAPALEDMEGGGAWPWSMARKTPPPLLGGEGSE